MTREELEQIIEAVDEVMGRRMEQVYGEIEVLKQAVADAVMSVNATAQVLHDNDTAIMGRLMQLDGSVAAEFTEHAAAAWRGFIVGEAKKLGVNIMVAKS